MGCNKSMSLLQICGGGTLEDERLPFGERPSGLDGKSILVKLMNVAFLGRGASDSNISTT